MAGGDEKTPPSSPKKPFGGKGGEDAESSGKGEVVRVIREIGGAASWPMLTKTNYTQWSLVMKVKMQARNLWGAIKPGGVSLQEDYMALDAITNAVPPEMVASLAAKNSALEAWNAVKERRIGSEQVQKMEAQRLLREFENIRFNGGEGVDDFTLRLQNIVAALETVGETIPPRRVVEKLLRVVPKSLRQVAVAIQVTAASPRYRWRTPVGSCVRRKKLRLKTTGRRLREPTAGSTSPRSNGRCAGGNAATRSVRAAAADVRRREAVAAAMKTAATTTTGRAAFVPVQAGVVVAPARGGASTVAFAATVGTALRASHKHLYQSLDQ
ncbi:unnamed protein product [Urochloa humidicola]